MCGKSNSSSEAESHDGDASGSPIVSSGPVDGSHAEGYNDASVCLLELAANNDLDKFKRVVEQGIEKVDVVGKWYSRHTDTAQMVLEERTPAMIAALYGSLDVLQYILKAYSVFGGDVNERCGNDCTTALHCAAAGGSTRAVEVVTLLLEAGADLDACDAHCRRPADVIAKSGQYAGMKTSIGKLLKAKKFPLGMDDFLPELDEGFYSDKCENRLKGLKIPSISSAVQSPFSSPSPSSSPKLTDMAPVKAPVGVTEKAREYPVDSSIPDIKSSAYSTDEFRMFSFKIRPCSRAYSHDWTECPFVHPGENARRRDPRRYYYSCVPCPDFRKGSCRRGDACEYAHGVFECWLHPAQYRTRLCKDGTACTRRVCFFAHTTEELRPLYVSTGSGVPSPRGSSSLDMAAMSPPLAPCSPSSSTHIMSPFSTSSMAHNCSRGGVVTPPMSPSSPHAGAWSPGGLPTLHLPGSNLQGSRLRAELNARDLSLEDVGEFDGQLSDFSSFSSQTLSTQARLNAAMAASACGLASSRSGKYGAMKLEELFASEGASSPRSVASPRSLSSPRAMLQESSLPSQLELQLLAYKSSRLQSQLQNELKNSHCASRGMSPRSDQLQLHLDHAAMDPPFHDATFMQSPKQPPSFSLGSLARMSALGGLETERMGGDGSALSPSHVAARAAFIQRDKRSHSSRDLGGSLKFCDRPFPTGSPDWRIQGDELFKFRRSASFGSRQLDEPDMTWEQRGPEVSDVHSSSDIVDAGSKRDADLAVLESWIDNMRLDQIVA